MRDAMYDEHELGCPGPFHTSPSEPLGPLPKKLD